ncbi:MAG: hypothetical protein AB7H88_09115 [Vicinamibacterales bacterium]
MKLSRLAVLVVTVSLAGCGGGSSGGSSPTAPTPTPTPAAVSVTVNLTIGPATASTAQDGLTMSSHLDRMVRVQGTVAAQNGFADVSGNCRFTSAEMPLERPLFETRRVAPGSPSPVDEVLRFPFTSQSEVTCTITGTGQDGTTITVGQTLPFQASDLFFTPQTCVPGDTTLCALNGRFRVEATWRDAAGLTGPGHVQDGGRYNDGGYFWFFDAQNYNLLVQVLDQCPSQNRYWVFMAGQTDVAVDVVVTDTQTGAVRSYANPLGNPFQPVQDTSAFATCP